MDELVLDLIDFMPGNKIRIKAPKLSLAVDGTMDRQNCSLQFTGRSFTAGDGILGGKELSLAAGLSRWGKGLFPVESGDIEFKAKALDSQYKGNRVTGRTIIMTAGIKPDRKKKKLSLNFEGALEGGRFLSDAFTLSMVRAGVSGNVSLDQDYTPSAKLDLRVKNAGLDIKDQGLSCNGIGIHLPLRYPFKSATRPGHLQIESIIHDNRDRAGLSAVLRQARGLDQGMEIALAGKVVSKDIPDLVFNLDLGAGVDPVSLTPWTKIRLESDTFVLSEEDLARALPGEEIPGSFSIALSSESRISMKNNLLDTRTSIRVHDGNLDFPDLDLKVAGLSATIGFNNLLVPETLPGQSLFVKSVDAGQFRFDNGVLRFSIEDGRFLNIENLTFNWCNGRVSTESVRLPAPDDNIVLTLYCDRLEMDSLLRQIGSFDAQGGGTLNGRIPVVYNKGNISFDNGFLFSTPGQGGRIFVKDLDRMLDDFPRDTPQFSQLDLAGEALKDFEYEWAKLSFNTQDDTLDVRMELDGKPAGVLPFEYRKDMNSFMRVDATSPGSRFQGVKLDVNLKLPFNRVMKFGNNLKSILE